MAMRPRAGRSASRSDEGEQRVVAQRAKPLWGLLVLLALGCESGQYQRLAQQRSVEDCLRYLDRYPTGEHSADVRRWLDQLRYRAAVEADTPFAYRRYLELQREGGFRAQAERRLARALLRGAQTLPDLLVVLERYPQTPAAQRARRRLAELLAKQALESDDPRLMKRFIARFPQHPAVARIRARRAEIAYRSLDDGPRALERFLQSDPPDPWSTVARKRLRRQLLARLRETQRAEWLRRFAAWFADDPTLPQIRSRWKQLRLQRALARVDASQLEELDSEGGERGRSVLERCRADRRACDRLQRLALAAQPWRPSGGWESTLRRAYSTDPLSSWRAIAALGYGSDQRAGQRLWELLGDARVGTVWLVARSLRRWLALVSSARRDAWHRRAQRESGEPLGPRAALRAGYAVLLRGKGEAGRARLTRLARGANDTALLAAVLLLATDHDLGQAASATLRAVGERLSQLTSSFPRELTAKSQLTAIALERELFILSELTRRLAGESTTSHDPSALHEQMREQLRQWWGRLKQANPAFEPAYWVDLRRVVAAHEKAMGPALSKLLRAGAAGGDVARAICEVSIAPELALRSAEAGQSLARVARLCQQRFADWRPGLPRLLPPDD
jgi:hypothetical protein